MLAELGHFCLILALCLAVLQVLAFISTAFTKTIYIQNAALLMIRSLALGQAFFIILTYVFLTSCFLLDDFSVAYVAQNSNSSLPIYYKITAVWGAHEGSLLLWILILSLWMLAVASVSRSWVLEFSSKVLAVMGLVNVGFLMLMLKSSNPFLRILNNVPLDGADLNPLLQDVGMISHPPILYLGYVGTTVAFAFSIAALLQGKLDQTWARDVRPWAILSWIFLTLGITLGSWWAYYELGWGGWWFWDPVENASFMPWLTATALLHCLSVSANRGQLLRLALFLAITTFALSLLGTFIVRSGVITSVHSFASDPQRGLFILQFLTIIVGGALFLYGARAPRLQLPATNERLRSGDAYLLANNIVLLVAAGTVLLGTLYPLIYEVLFSLKISVGYPYFNAVFVPLMIILFAIMLPGIQSNKKILLLTIIVSIVLAFVFLHFWFAVTKIKALVGVAIAFAIFISTVQTVYKHGIKSRLGMTIAHIGLVVTIIGVSITPAYEIERDLRFNLGDVVNIANFAIKFNDLQVVDGPNYISSRAEFLVSNKNTAEKLFPEKRLYLAQELPMTETAILPGVFQDIYIALGQQLEGSVWSTRIYYKPFVRWIWSGAILMILGAIYAFSQGKNRYVK